MCICKNNKQNKEVKPDWEIKAEKLVNTILSLEHLAGNAEDMFTEFCNNPDNETEWSEEALRVYVGDYAKSLRKELSEELAELESEFDDMAHDII
jgi:hypothetical protein